MTWTAWGLISNMLGVGIVFFVGFPQPEHDGVVAITLQDATPLSDGRTVGQVAADAARRKVIYRVLSIVGLLCMFVGFLLQFVDAYSMSAK
jgi:hypothetical protein